MKMHNFDVYMQPLIDKLQELWRGVSTYDLLRVESQRHFILRAILMWTIHDYPTYGLVFRCVHWGYKTCVSCGLDVTSRHSLELGKVVHEGFHRWLPINHPYKRNWNLTHCNGKEELKTRPHPITTTDILKNVVEH
jgi:hypothetical protein